MKIALTRLGGVAPAVNLASGAAMISRGDKVPPKDHAWTNAFAGNVKAVEGGAEIYKDHCAQYTELTRWLTAKGSRRRSHSIGRLSLICALSKNRMDDAPLDDCMLAKMAPMSCAPGRKGTVAARNRGPLNNEMGNQNAAAHYTK